MAGNPVRLTAAALSEAVRSAYEERNLPCTQAMLEVLGQCFGYPIPPRVWDAASGLHGAGRYGAQCGLVEGGLMFLGLRATELGYDKSQIEDLCSGWAAHFERCFSSLICRELRPEGFGPHVPPHRCMPLTVSALREAVGYAAPLFRDGQSTPVSSEDV